MPPFRIRPCRNERHDAVGSFRLLDELRGPELDLAVWRVAEDAPTLPRMIEAAVFFGVVCGAEMILEGGRRVEVEQEPPVQLVEQVLRRRPFVGLGRKHALVNSRQLTLPPHRNSFFNTMPLDS